VKALASAAPPINFINAAAVGIAGGLQALAVAATPLPKFEKGGEIGGKLHSEGGTPIEAQKGEYVINREGYENAPELTRAINSGIVTDNNISGLSPAQKDSLTASLLMQGISQNKLMIQALSNAGFAYENNGMIHIIKGNGEVNKFPKINPETSK